MSETACAVHVDDRQLDLPISHAVLTPLVHTVLATEQQFEVDEVWIHFVDKDEICRLHADYFDDPTPTDCISFPIDSAAEEGHCVLGEVIVCPKVAIEYVEKYGGDPYQEVALYVVHGLLHLLGYDDLEATAEKAMRAAEQRHLAKLEEIIPRLRRNNTLS